MFKKILKMRNVAAIAACLAVFNFASCDKIETPENDDGWPPASELAKFTVGDWARPSGISGIAWGSTTENRLTITFETATKQTADDIQNYFLPRGYYCPSEYYIVTEFDDYTHYNATYEREDVDYEYVIDFTFNVPGGGGILLMRAPKDGGDDPDIPVTNFTITGSCSIPANGMVYAVVGNPSSALDWVMNYGGTTNYAGAGVKTGASVTWETSTIPPVGTYTLIMMGISDDGLYKATGVAIGAGGAGTVACSEFSVLPNN
jgi:hypothetical protein